MLPVGFTSRTPAAVVVTFSLPRAPPLTGARAVAPRRHRCPVGMMSAPTSGPSPVIVSTVPVPLWSICIVMIRAPPPRITCPSSSAYAPSAFQRPIWTVSDDAPLEKGENTPPCCGAVDPGETWYSSRSPVADTPSAPNWNWPPSVRLVKLLAVLPRAELAPWSSKSVLVKAPGNDRPTARS